MEGINQLILEWSRDQSADMGVVRELLSPMT